MSVRVAGAPQTTQALAPREEILLGHRRELSAYVRERLAEIGTARTHGEPSAQALGTRLGVHLSPGIP